MPIVNTKRGNVLDASERLIVHGNNPFGVWGAGLARAARIRYPRAHDRFKEAVRKKGPLPLGYCDVFDLGDGRYLVSAVTQSKIASYPGENVVSLEGISVAFERINNVARDFKFDVAIPKIGAGLAGGNWEEISEVINEATPDAPVTLYIHD